MASPRDTSQLASQPQRDTYSQGSRTLGRSVVAASEADSLEMGSTRDATPQAFEALQRKIERLEKKLKTTDERRAHAEAEVFKLREAESEAEQERESLEQENIQLKTRQPTEDSSYTAQLIAENTSLRELTWELKEKYEHALVYRRGRDTGDDNSNERFFEALRQNNDAIATFQETNRQNNDAIATFQETNRQNNDAIATFQETNSQLVHSFRHSREEKRDEDKSADGDLEEEVRQAFGDHFREGHPESESSILAETPFQSRWDQKNPNFQGTLEESREPPLGFGSFSLNRPARAKVTPKPQGSKMTLQAGPRPAPVSVDKTMTQEAKEAEEPIYLWVAQKRAEAREQESQNLSSTEKPRAAYSEVAKTETPPVKPTTGVASSSKTVLKPGTNPKAKLSPRTPDLPEATTTQPSPSVTGGKTDMPLREKEPQKGDSKPSNSTPVSQAISEPPQYASLPEQSTGFWRRGPRLAEATQAIPEDSRDEGQAEGAKGHVEDSTKAPKAPIGTGGSTVGTPATSEADRGESQKRARDWLAEPMAQGQQKKQRAEP